MCLALVHACRLHDNITLGDGVSLAQGCCNGHPAELCALLYTRYFFKMLPQKHQACLSHAISRQGNGEGYLHKGVSLLRAGHGLLLGCLEGLEPRQHLMQKIQHPPLQRCKTGPYVVPQHTLHHLCSPTPFPSSQTQHGLHTRELAVEFPIMSYMWWRAKARAVLSNSKASIEDGVRLSDLQGSRLPKIC